MSDPIGGKTYTQYRQQIINQYSQQRGTKHLRFSDDKQLYVHSGWKPSRKFYGATDRLAKRQSAAEELKQSINREFQQLAPNVGDKVFSHLKAQGHDFSTQGIKLNEQWRIDQAISDVLREEANNMLREEADKIEAQGHPSSQEALREDNLRTLSSRFEAVAQPSANPNQNWTGNKGTAQDKRLLRGWARLIGQANRFKAAINADYGSGMGKQVEDHLYFHKGVDINKGIGFGEIATARQVLKDHAPNTQPVHLNAFQQAKEAHLKNQALQPLFAETGKSIWNHAKDLDNLMIPARKYVQDHDNITKALQTHRQSAMQDWEKGAQLTQQLRENIRTGTQLLKDIEAQNPQSAVVKSLTEHLRAANELLLAHDPPQNRNLNRPPVQSLQALQETDQHQGLANAASTVNHYNQHIAQFGSQVNLNVLYTPYQGYQDQFSQVGENYQRAMADVQTQSQAFAANPSDENLAKLSAAVDKAGRASDRFLLMLNRANRFRKFDSKSDQQARAQSAGALHQLKNTVIEQRKGLQRLGWHASNINDIRNHLATELQQNPKFPIAPQHKATGDAQAAYDRTRAIELEQFVRHPVFNQPAPLNLPPAPPEVDLRKINTQDMPDMQSIYGEADELNLPPAPPKVDESKINTTQDMAGEVDNDDNDSELDSILPIEVDKMGRDDDAVDTKDGITDGNVITIDGKEVGEVDLESGEFVVDGGDEGAGGEVNNAPMMDGNVETIDIDIDEDNEPQPNGPKKQDEPDGVVTIGGDDDSAELYGLNEQDKQKAEKKNTPFGDDDLDGDNVETI